MPAMTSAEGDNKANREELLREALKEHIMRERRKKKEEREAEVEEERLRKEKEAQDRQDAMTLGETREQIELLNAKLEKFKNEKQQLFLQLKKVLNEDENRKRQQLKDSELFQLQYGVPLPTQFAPYPSQLIDNRTPVRINPACKRPGSPSGVPQQSYYKTANPPYSQAPKLEETRRGNEVGRAVLWNKPAQYQNPHGQLFYPPHNIHAGAGYPPYQNIKMPIYDINQQQQPSPSQTSQIKVGLSQAQVQSVPKPLPPQNNNEKSVNDRAFIIERKPDERIDNRQVQSAQGPIRSTVILDDVQQINFYNGMRAATITGIHPVGMPFQPVPQQADGKQGKPTNAQNMPQSYSTRGPTPNQQNNQQPPSQMHYSRHRY